MKYNLKLNRELKGLLKIGIVQFDQLIVQSRNDSLVRDIKEECDKVKDKCQSTDTYKELIEPMRKLYRSIKLDPTKNRPSSEALLRQAKKGTEIYQVNTLVNVCNLCSLHFSLSIGLYDVDKIVGTVIEVRLGQAGEMFAGIGKPPINAAGKLILADKTGPFGNPSSDSNRTKITLDTKRAMFVLFAPFYYDSTLLAEHLDFVENKVHQYHECCTVKKYVT